jgi:hypothetical protein
MADHGKPPAIMPGARSDGDPIPGQHPLDAIFCELSRLLPPGRRAEELVMCDWQAVSAFLLDGQFGRYRSLCQRGPPPSLTRTRWLCTELEPPRRASRCQREQGGDAQRTGVSATDAHRECRVTEACRPAVRILRSAVRIDLLADRSPGWLRRRTALPGPADMTGR